MASEVDLDSLDLLGTILSEEPHGFKVEPKEGSGNESGGVENDDEDDSAGEIDCVQSNASFCSRGSSQPASACTTPVKQPKMKDELKDPNPWLARM